MCSAGGNATAWADRVLDSPHPAQRLAPPWACREGAKGTTMVEERGAQTELRQGYLHLHNARKTPSTRMAGAYVFCGSLTWMARRLPLPGLYGEKPLLGLSVMMYVELAVGP